MDGLPEQARVLLADDEESFLGSTAELLRRSGYMCEVARDASEALHVLRTLPIDAMVTDLRMPGNADLRLLTEAKTEFPLLPVIVITGYPSVATAVAAVRVAAVDYLTKPFEFAELLTTVRRAIARGRLARAARPRDGDAAAWVAAHLDHAGGSVPPTRAAHGEELESLSAREREILEWMVRGQRVATIAPALRISSHTVRNHVKSIFRKLGVHSQLELVGRFR